MSLAHLAKQSLELVDRQHCGSWIIDSLRKRLDGDIDDDAEGEGRVLFESAFRAKCDSPEQPSLVDGARPVYSKKWVPRPDEVTHARNKLSPPVRLGTPAHKT